MGAPVGSIDKIEPAGDKMKVTFHYANEVQGAGQRLRSRSEPQLWWRRATSSCRRPIRVAR